MNMEEKEDNTIYKVVLNHEEQYSVWPANQENPLWIFHKSRRLAEESSKQA
jgi:uncharacterized protein YbdZ (MbtH family)